MLGALVLKGVGGEVDGADVVTVDQSGPRQGAMQLHKQLSKPTRLCHTIGHGVVLCISARSGDDVLTLRGPGDEIVAQEHRVARSGPASVGTTGPVNISVDDEVRRRGTAKKQAMVNGALEVPKDALRGREMGLTRVVHVEAHLLDRVGNVGPSECEVLESPNQTAVGSRVTYGDPHGGGDLGMSVDRCGAGLAVPHASTLKNVPSILALVKEEVVGLLLYCDTEKVVKRVEVLHRELLLKSCSGTLETLRARGGEDDVANVEQQVSSVGVAVVDEQRGIRLGLHEAQGDQVGGEAVVPRSRHLLQAVEGLVEPTHQLRVRGVNEADRLRAVDGLGECAMEEGILDVELVHGPTPRESQHSLDGGRLDNEAEGLIVVHSETLSEPSDDSTSLVPIKRAIRFELVLEDPLTGDDFGPRRLRNQVPRDVRQQGLVLLHSAMLVGIRERATDIGRDQRQCQGSRVVDDPWAW
jgi:hypothetical protein